MTCGGGRRDCAAGMVEVLEERVGLPPEERDVEEDDEARGVGRVGEATGESSIQK